MRFRSGSASREPWESTRRSATRGAQHHRARWWRWAGHLTGPGSGSNAGPTPPTPTSSRPSRRPRCRGESTDRETHYGLDEDGGSRGTPASPAWSKDSHSAPILDVQSWRGRSVMPRTTETNVRQHNGSSDLSGSWRARIVLMIKIVSPFRLRPGQSEAAADAHYLE